MPTAMDAYLNSTWGGAYCDSNLGTGTFRLDAGCWGGYLPAFRVEAEEPVVRSAEITSPLPGSTVSGMVDFTAFLTDDEVDSIQWAVRQGTCAAGTNTVFGNVDGKTDVATIDSTDPANQTFSFTGDMSAMDPGMYCFIYNPAEDAGEAGIRLTSEFTLEEPVVEPEFPTSKDMCKSDGWRSFSSVVFRNQGDCVSWVVSSENAEGNRKDN
ncbi:hypothetical protein HYV12_02965 [Candidatus Dojkabacteria bacterium]|nr:hypothetical protein [Candidatus Dojkabacteria bacterium]